MRRAGIEFWGQSFIAAPDGRILVRAPHDQRGRDRRGDRPRARSTRAAIGWPFFRDRRIDAYAEITQRFGGD